MMSFVIVTVILLLAVLPVVIGLNCKNPNDDISEKEKNCEHDWQFVGFDIYCMDAGILRCIYQCKKCGKVISI